MRGLSVTYWIVTSLVGLFLVFALADTLGHAKPPSAIAPIPGCFRVGLDGEVFVSCKQFWSNPLDWWEAGQDI